MLIHTAVSPGELLDKISILEIKRDNIRDPEKRNNVLNELNILSKIREEYLPMAAPLPGLYDQLKAVNLALWDIEDRIRDCERAKVFDAVFIELARSVYMQNDKRADLKKQINVLCGSQITEEKSYAKY